MKKKVGLVVLSVLALLGTFLPVAFSEDFYINISHLKGLSLLLYVIALTLLVLSVVNIYKEIKYIKAWFIVASVFGLVILLFSTVAGINTLDYIIQKKLAFEEKQRKFEEEFNKGWEESDGLKSNEKTESEEAKSQQIQNSQQMPAPSAGPGLGTYLILLGLSGILVLNLFPEKKEQQTA